MPLVLPSEASDQGNVEQRPGDDSGKGKGKRLERSKLFDDK